MHITQIFSVHNVNGKLIAAIEEERLNRKKHFAGYPIGVYKRMFKDCKERFR